jgi:hypothetical protein
MCRLDKNPRRASRWLEVFVYESRNSLVGANHARHESEIGVNESRLKNHKAVAIGLQPIEGTCMNSKGVTTEPARRVETLTNITKSKRHHVATL